MVIIAHLVAVRAAYLAPPRFLPHEESSNTFSKKAARAPAQFFLTSSPGLETKESFDSKGARPLLFYGREERQLYLFVSSLSFLFSESADVVERVRTLDGDKRRCGERQEVECKAGDRDTTDKKKHPPELIDGNGEEPPKLPRRSLAHL